MIFRLAHVTAVLGCGTVLTAALFWGLLNTPEANVLMLGLSALLGLTVLACASVTISTAVLVARDVASRDALSAGPGAVGWFLLAFAPLALAWLAIGRFDSWVAAHQGEINAWFIARFGWADVSWLMRAELWISRWLRWAMLPVLSLSLLAACLTRERHRAWVRRALHWRTMLAATFAFAVLMALPWQLTTWRPELPSTWVQPAVAALRLGTACILALIGTALLVVVSTHPGTSEPRS